MPSPNGYDGAMKNLRERVRTQTPTSRLIVLGGLLILAEIALLAVGLNSATDDRLESNTNQFLYLIAALGLSFTLFNVFLIIRIVRHDSELELAKRVFISLASHELRTPATAVKYILTILLDGYAGGFSSEQRNYLHLAHESNERQLKIIQALLYAGQLESNQLKLDCNQLNLSRLIRQSIDDYSEAINARHQTLHVKLKDHIAIRADEICLRIVVDNLLRNATKYTPEGGTITVSLDRNDNVAIMSIQDTGIGIASHNIKRLFRKFSRLENPLSTQAGGTGLGLYITKQMVALHDGTISASSELGKGTTFTVTLPLDVVQPSAGIAL